MGIDILYILYNSGILKEEGEYIKEKNKI